MPNFEWFFNHLDTEIVICYVVLAFFGLNYHDIITKTNGAAKTVVHSFAYILRFLQLIGSTIFLILVWMRIHWFVAIQMLVLGFITSILLSLLFNRLLAKQQNVMLLFGFIGLAVVPILLYLLIKSIW